MTSKQWLDAMYKHASELTYAARQTQRLSDAFARTGNASVAEELLVISDSLAKEAENARKLVGAKLSHELAAAQQGHAALLKGMLAVAELGVDSAK